MLHSSDWYRTLVEGVAKGTVPANTGPVPVDGVDAWDAIINDKASPRTEVVHQVRRGAQVLDAKARAAGSSL